MKRLLPLFLLLATAVFAQEPVPTPTPMNNAELVKELERTQARLVAAVSGLSEAQWNFKPAPDRWSIAEVMEHITASETLIRGMVEAAMKKEATPEMLQAGIKKDDILKKGMTDRTKKFKAPEPLQPTNRFGSGAAALAIFQIERSTTTSLASSDVDLRTHGDTHPIVGPLDAYGYFLFLSGHSERHTMQIEEVKADPNFPKN